MHTQRPGETEVSVDIPFKKIKIFCALFYNCLKFAQSFPAAFVYCQGARTELYQPVLEQLIKLAPGMQKNVKIVFTDFEQAVVKAFRLTLPHVTIQGCWFHYCQVHV